MMNSPMGEKNPIVLSVTEVMRWEMGRAEQTPWFRCLSIRHLYPREELIWALVLLNQWHTNL